MENRMKPEKIEMHQITGRIIELKKDKLKFVIDGGSKELKKEIKYRVQEIKKTKNNVFNKPYFDNLPLRLFYFNQESLKGLYKNPEMNLPYEILSSGWNLVYRQDALIRKKKDILSELEQAAIDEGLRN